MTDNLQIKSPPHGRYTRILATGSYLPTTVLTNAQLEERVATTDQWIVERTGIRQRHIATPEESTAYMASQAALQALQAANLTAKDIDLVIVATTTPDQIFPNTACLVQQQLNIPIGPAFDISAACAGFSYTLSVANQFIQSGAANRALVIGSETMSRLVDWEDRSTCVLFGDGAGAVILEASEQPGILSTHLGADGRYKDILYTVKHPTATGNLIKMMGNEVFRQAVTHLEQLVMSTLQANQLSSQAIDWLIPHQANLRIIQALAKKLNMTMEQVVVTLDQHGNTSAASIPLALDTAIRANKIKRGQTLLLESFGAGLTWGSALIIY